MALTTSTRSFRVGETIHLLVRTSTPGGRVPVDVAVVTLTALRLGTSVITVTDSSFVRQAEGDYTLVVPTVGLLPGEYDLVITVSDGPLKVSIVTDRFALRAV